MMTIALVFIVISSINTPSSIADLEKPTGGRILRLVVLGVKRKAGRRGSD
jgi:hypothetical protein